MNIVEKIAAALLSFLIALASFVAILSLVFSKTVCDPAFMEDVLSKNHYYDSIFEEYCESVESLAIPAGIDEGVFSGVVKKQEFCEYINKILYAAYNDQTGYAGDVFNYDGVYSRFYSSMTEFAEGKGIAVTDELTEGLDNVATLCASTCRTYCTLPFIDTIGGYATEFSRYFNLSAVLASVFALFLIILLCISKKWRSIALLLASIAAMTDGLMLTAAPAAILISGKIRYLQIELKSLYLFAVGYSEELLLRILISGLVLIAFAAALFVIYNVVLYKHRGIKTQ